MAPEATPNPRPVSAGALSHAADKTTLGRLPATGIGEHSAVRRLTVQRRSTQHRHPAKDRASPDGDVNVFERPMRTEKQNTQRPADHYTPHGRTSPAQSVPFTRRHGLSNSGRSIGRSHSLKRNASVSSSLTPSTSTAHPHVPFACSPTVSARVDKGPRSHRSDRGPNAHPLPQRNTLPASNPPHLARPLRGRLRTPRGAQSGSAEQRTRTRPQCGARRRGNNRSTPPTARHEEHNTQQPGE